METPLDEQYLTWLYARIGSVKETRRSRTYWDLLRQLYVTEFIWLIPNDDNRVEDGRDLRYEFLDDAGLSGDVDPNWMGEHCSVLEMLFGVAKRLTFEADRSPRFWFWELLNNLGLSGYTDAEFNEQRVIEIIETLVTRTYQPNGLGGLFPLRYAIEDQREVEIWYQAQNYLLDQN